MARSNDEPRLTDVLFMFIGLGAMLWAGAEIADMSVLDFAINVIGAFVAAHPSILLALGAWIVVIVFDDELDRLLCAALEGILFNDRAKSLDGGHDAQAREILAGRRLS